MTRCQRFDAALDRLPGTAAQHARWLALSVHQIRSYRMRAKWEWEGRKWTRSGGEPDDLILRRVGLLVRGWERAFERYRANPKAWPGL